MKYTWVCSLWDSCVDFYQRACGTATIFVLRSLMGKLVSSEGCYSLRRIRWERARTYFLPRCGTICFVPHLVSPGTANHLFYFLMYPSPKPTKTKTLVFLSNRTQRLREAAASRPFHLKNTPVLRDLAFEPYTFVASAPAPAEGSGGGSSGGGGGRGGEDGWDDWGDDETADVVRSGGLACKSELQCQPHAVRGLCSPRTVQSKRIDIARLCCRLSGATAATLSRGAVLSGASSFTVCLFLIFSSITRSPHPMSYIHPAQLGYGLLAAS